MQRTNNSLRIEYPKKKDSRLISESLFCISRRFLTLVEMLIVITLLAIAASVIGFNSAKMIREQHFRTGTEVILDKLQMAQNIMLIFKCETQVVLERKPGSGGLVCKIAVNKELPSGLEEAVNLSPVIPGIDSFFFEDEQRIRYEDKVALPFSSMHLRIPFGTLFLFGSKELKRDIYLPGYPSPIGSSTKNMLQETSVYESELLYPMEIRQDWLQRHQKKT